MKELDLLLLRYLEQHWARAGAAEQAAFERLLDLTDPQLVAMLLGQEAAPDAGMQGIVARLRDR